MFMSRIRFRPRVMRTVTHVNTAIICARDHAYNRDRDLIASRPQSTLAAGSHVQPQLFSKKHMTVDFRGKPIWLVDATSKDHRMLGLKEVEWDVICDVRSPAEFEKDHVQQAINMPVLNDEEHAQVGVVYNRNQFDARRLGAAFVARNLGLHLASEPFSLLPVNANILVYCWRGGERSKSMAHVLARVGWNVGLVHNGYKGYREHVREALEQFGRFQYHVIGGGTGSAKGKMLDTLRAEGAQVIDLEGLANHKGSILGAHPETAQPTQKLFESKLTTAMQDFVPSRPIFVEAESRRVGKLQIPSSMFNRMQEAPRTTMHLPMNVRVAWIRQGYRHFESTHVEPLKLALNKLKRHVGSDRVKEWSTYIETANWDKLVTSLLVHHYDTAYKISTSSIKSACQTRIKTETETETESAAPTSIHDALYLSDTSDTTFTATAKSLLEDLDPLFKPNVL
eukprot:m.10539 g.10539  ORF g.10539 m.10539 type:complete len:453 (+) comp8379_c0_seq1:442-1800(+)